ncbi:MAG: threonine--tRNA ligase [Candidatus Methylarchaceae archaeon HK01M]|nr:threonine--tRNA ligase [Candidatus Methylarchaceae archaeon HK01M]
MLNFQPGGYYLVNTDGEVYSIEEARIKDRNLQALVDSEVYKKSSTKRAPHIELMKKLKVAGYEELSDPGHVIFKPKGNLIFDLLADRTLQIALELGANLVKTPIFYDLSFKSISEHARLFGQRMYKVKSGKRTFALRYAACFGQFSLLSDSTLSYRDLPLKIFELADSYRLEQRGELIGLNRLRKFHMPDMHILCLNIKEAKIEFEKICKRCLEEGHRFGWNYTSLYNVSKDFIEDPKGLDYVRSLVKMEGNQVLLHVVESGMYYWIINIEFNFVSQQGRIIESSTAQIDVGNAERFNISYVDEEGKERRPVIIHTAVIGSLERFMADLLEKASSLKTPSLPTWICPVQVRIINVGIDSLQFAIKLAENLNINSIRADVDDRSESVAKKVANAEVEWIPYVVVVGKKEVEGGNLSVRVRSVRKKLEMSEEELVKTVKEETKGWPYRPLYFNILVSKRPSFV